MFRREVAQADAKTKDDDNVVKPSKFKNNRDGQLVKKLTESTEDNNNMSAKGNEGINLKSTTGNRESEKKLVNNIDSIYAGALKSRSNATLPASSKPETISQSITSGRASSGLVAIRQHNTIAVTKGMQRNSLPESTSHKASNTSCSHGRYQKIDNNNPLNKDATVKSNK